MNPDEHALGPEEKRELERFAWAIAVAQGFVFHIVVADTWRVVRAALDREFSDILRIIPDLESARDPHELASSVLGQLQAALHSDQGQLVLIDATSTSLAEEEGWRNLFRQLNQQRNQLIQYLNRPLVLCVSPRLETAFGHEAPDFWSISGSGMRLADRTPAEELPGRCELIGQLGLTPPEPAEVVAQEARIAAAKDSGSGRTIAIELARLGALYRNTDRREEALAVAEEAVSQYRELATTNPDTVLPDLARSLIQLGNSLSALGRREQALDAIGEAVELVRQLSADRPDAFRPDLAGSLNHHGLVLRDLGRGEQALDATQEAVEILGQLAANRPDAFLPDLASSLNNLGLVLCGLGRREQALDPTQEAAEIVRQLAASRPDPFLPDLARALDNLGLVLRDLGRREQALDATQEAAEIRRQLAISP